MKKTVCRECQKKLMGEASLCSLEQFHHQWDRDNIVVCPDAAVKSGALMTKCKDQRITAFEGKLEDLSPEAVEWCPCKEDHYAA